MLVPSIYAVGFLLALAGLLFDPAKNVAVRSVVGTERICRALALSRATESAAPVLGPAVGSAGLVFDALTFVAGAGLSRPPKCRGRGPFLVTVARRPSCDG